jgi:hypothetical protein
MLQLLINQGDFAFVDRSDELHADFSEDASYDYSMRAVDLDGSGINSYLMAAKRFCTPMPEGCVLEPARHGNYLLVNDGTGTLRAALHDGFAAMTAEVDARMAAELTGPQFVFGGGQIIPSFIPFQNDDGGLDFLVLPGVSENVGGEWYLRQALVTYDADYHLATDYADDLVVADRRGSRRIRTFAGDDTIHATGAGATCAIDGGLGTDTAVYPGPRADYTIAAAGEVTTVTGGGGVDSLRRIERLQFSDETVDLP